MKLNVNEIFYSLQGEGARTGEPSVFIRLTKCNLRCAFCDTDFEAGNDMTVHEIADAIKKYPSKWIIWTGGEPTIQLKDKHIAFFKQAGYKQAIETNGTRPVSPLIDYISCSPKQDFGKVRDIIPLVNEIRIPVRKGDELPDIGTLPKAGKYYLSPVFDGEQINRDNLGYCISAIMENPAWALSIQMHKLINIQ